MPGIVLQIGKKLCKEISFRRSYQIKAMGYVYILSNKSREVFYTGVTGNWPERIWQHRNGEGSSFTKKYKTKYLMYYEEYSLVVDAIEREKRIKKWKREWKINLIKSVNPQMRDLWIDLRGW